MLPPTGIHIHPRAIAVKWGSIGQGRIGFNPVNSGREEVQSSALNPTECCSRGYRVMEIRIESLLAGAKGAKGVVVVIDVYRAFTTASVALMRGAERIVLTADIDDALMLYRQKVGELTVGEVGGKKPEGFDYGNSPQGLSELDLRGKTPILSTRAGTVGVNAARHADEVFGVALINAMATVRAIRRRNPSLVTLVPMGQEGLCRADEDELCAIYLKNLLLERKMDPDAIRQIILASSESAKFDDPKQPHFPPKDRDWALHINEAPFAIRIARKDRMLIATREEG